MKKNLILIISLLLIITNVSAQTKSIHKSPVLTEGTPESVGISSERLARIDNMCEQEVANGNLPGIVALVARNGKIVFVESLWDGR